MHLNTSKEERICSLCYITPPQLRLPSPSPPETPLPPDDGSLPYTTPGSLPPLIQATNKKLQLRKHPHRDSAKYEYFMAGSGTFAVPVEQTPAIGINGTMAYRVELAVDPAGDGVLGQGATASKPGNNSKCTGWLIQGIDDFDLIDGTSNLQSRSKQRAEDVWHYQQHERHIYTQEEQRLQNPVHFGRATKIRIINHDQSLRHESSYTSDKYKIKLLKDQPAFSYEKRVRTVHGGRIIHCYLILGTNSKGEERKGWLIDYSPAPGKRVDQLEFE